MFFVLHVILKAIIYICLIGSTVQAYNPQQIFMEWFIEKLACGYTQLGCIIDIITLI